MEDNSQPQPETEHISFGQFPPTIQNIVEERPDGWEYSLTAALMRHFLDPLFRQIEDLHNGLVVKHGKCIQDDAAAIAWLQAKMHQGEHFVEAFVPLVERLNESWGPRGQDGDAAEILHICRLLRDLIQQIIYYEEDIRFVTMPDKFTKLTTLLRDVLASQALKLQDIPDSLDHVVAMIGTDHGGTSDNPTIYEKTISLTVPAGWQESIEMELQNLERGQQSTPADTTPGCLSWLITLLFLAWIISVL